MEEEIIELLSRRGFFIDHINGKFYLSDNSEKSDSLFLNQILEEKEIGFLSLDNEIHIQNISNANRLQELFMPVPKGTVGTGSNNRRHKWYIVKGRFHADKISVNLLEANIARYIKALSACGIYTGGCCDGNHPSCHSMFIEFDGPIYLEFHKLLWETHLNKYYSIKWNERYDKINLLNDRQHQYDELNKAATYIYEKRNCIIRIRFEAAKWIKKSLLKKMSDKEVAELFLENAKSILMNGADYIWR